jgi:hypothetical protein
MITDSTGGGRSMIVITEQMEDAFFDAAYQPHEQVLASMTAGLKAALTSLTPEEKRELASQLLRSASTDEGYSEDTA